MPALPTAHRIRPRFGSEAKKAVFTSGEWAIDLPTRRHSSRVAPPSTTRVMNLVAPSPSRTIACDRTCATSSTHSASRVNSAVPSPSMRGLPARPVATRTKESFVEVSPSTVTALNERSATKRTMSCRVSPPTAASVATNPSMVAMLGWIIPAPLAMPVTVIFAPSITTWRETALGTVSVVMMAAAASAHASSRRFATAAGIPATRRSTGRCSMITPVEKGSTARASTPSALATAAQVARASASPVAPVPALAIPVFTTRARIRGRPARCSRQTVTGAAQ